MECNSKWTLHFSFFCEWNICCKVIWWIDWSWKI